jgi:DNA-binding response OmpR family regulator
MTATSALNANGARWIVFVEDDPDLRSLYGEVLRAAGFEVVECPTLESAFSALEVLRPDIVLLDRDLPDGSGLDLARWLRATPSRGGVRIVGFSGRSAPRDVEAAIAAGCDAFVEKPCTPEKLIAALDRPVDRVVA